MADLGAPSLVAVVAEKEEELALLRVKTKSLEQELWAARKVIRRGRRIDALRMSGFGSLGGNVLGAFGWLGTDNPWCFVFGAILGAAFGFILGHVWDPLDDGVGEANVSMPGD